MTFSYVTNFPTSAALSIDVNNGASTKYLTDPLPHRRWSSNHLSCRTNNATEQEERDQVCQVVARPDALPRVTDTTLLPSGRHRLDPQVWLRSKVPVK